MIRDGIFRKASGSETGGCVEVAALPGGGVRVRDSKNRDGSVVRCTDRVWQRFVREVRVGQAGPAAR